LYRYKPESGSKSTSCANLFDCRLLQNRALVIIISGFDYLCSQSASLAWGLPYSMPANFEICRDIFKLMEAIRQ
jgi:hypothetical protein